jgi:hypothetical protein
VVVEAVPFARPGAHLSRDLDDLLAWLATRMDKSAVARLCRVSWRTVGRACERGADSELDPDRLDGLFRIGVDEISWRKQHKYLTLVVDHDRGKVIWGAKGKDAATLDQFFDELGPERSAQLSAVSLDLGPAFLQLERGCTWHRAMRISAAPHTVRTPALSVTARASTFMVTMEHDGSCFVVVLHGTVAVIPRGNGPAVGVGEAQAMVWRPDHGFSAVIDVTEEEMARDRWVARNRPLDALADGLAPSSTSPRGVAVRATVALSAAALSLLMVFTPSSGGDRPLTLIEGSASGSGVAPTSTASSPGMAPSTTAVSGQMASTIVSPVPEVAPPVPPPDAPAFSTAVGDCRGSGEAAVVFKGTVTNLDAIARRYRLHLRITDRSGATRHEIAPVVDVAPQVEAAWQVEAPLVDRAGGRCHLDGVEVL